MDGSRWEALAFDRLSISRGIVGEKGKWENRELRSYTTSLSGLNTSTCSSSRLRFASCVVCELCEFLSCEKLRVATELENVVSPVSRSKMGEKVKISIPRFVEVQVDFRLALAV